MQFSFIGAGHPPSVVLMDRSTAKLSGTLLRFSLRFINPCAMGLGTHRQNSWGDSKEEDAATQRRGKTNHHERRNKWS